MALKMTIIACVCVCVHRQRVLEAHKVTSIRLIFSQLIHSDLQRAPHVHVLRCAPSFVHDARVLSAPPKGPA